MKPITISIENNVATITNNDAPYNRMTLEYMDALEEALPELGADENVRALIFTAAGEENFCPKMQKLPQINDFYGATPVSGTATRMDIETFG